MLVSLCFNLSGVKFDTFFFHSTFSTGFHFNITSFSLFQLLDLVLTRTTCRVVAFITESSGSLKNSGIFQFSRAWFKGWNMANGLEVEHVGEGLDRENFPDRRRRLLLVEFRHGPGVALVFIASGRCAVRRVLTSRRKNRSRRNRRCERRD